ncbi:MAG: PAS domain S-box protein, partial [Ferruginibacter sp.]
MDKHPKGADRKQTAFTKKTMAALTGDKLHQQAFDNSLQPNIITIAGSGKIIAANSAACKLLGYSKKELLTKTRSTIFDVNESSFKNMLKQRTAEGHSIAYITVIKKSGKSITCKIT